MHWRCDSWSCSDEMRARLGGNHTPVRRATRLCIVLVRITSCGAALPVNAAAAFIKRIHDARWHKGIHVRTMLQGS